MNREEDSVGLFGRGIGSSTCYELKCELCGTVHNKGLDPENDTEEGISVLYDYFLGCTVAECCFVVVENSVLNNMDDIVLWYVRILKRRQIINNNRISALDLIKEK